MISIISDCQYRIRKRQPARDRYPKRAHYDTSDSSYTKSEKKKRRWLFFPRPSPIPYSKFRFLIILLSIRLTGKQPYKYGQCRSYSENSLGRCTKQTQDITRQINRKEYALIQRAPTLRIRIETNIRAYEKKKSRIL